MSYRSKVSLGSEVIWYITNSTYINNIKTDVETLKRYCCDSPYSSKGSSGGKGSRDVNFNRVGGNEHMRVEILKNTPTTCIPDPLVGEPRREIKTDKGSWFVFNNERIWCKDKATLDKYRGFRNGKCSKRNEKDGKSRY